MKKFFTFCAAMLVAFAVNATPVVLPATLDVSNVSFRSEGMPDFVIADGQDYAGTYFDMGAHDSSNDTLLYAEWDVTIEPIKYNVAIDVYNTNSWRIQLYLLNQAGDTLKSIRYKGSSGQKGQYAIGTMDMSDLAAGNYKVRAHCAYSHSAMKLKDIILTANYSGVTVDLPGTLLPAYAELSANASITNDAIAFKPATANDEYATWNVSFAQAGDFKAIIDITGSNCHNYSVALLSSDGVTEIDAVAEGSCHEDSGVKELGIITVPAAGNYVVKLTNATQWSNAVLSSITFEISLPFMGIVGEMNGWSATELVPSADKKTASCTIHLDMNNNSGYGFKVIVGNDPHYIKSNPWYSFHRGWTGVANIPVENDQDNAFWLSIDMAGDYIFTWTIANDSLHITFPEPLADGYYLVGKTGWDLDDLSADLLFTVNPLNNAEYLLDITLAAGDQFKVAKVQNNSFLAEGGWFPDGVDNNYVVAATHAGADKTVYFRPNGDGGSGWHYGYIYIDPNPIQVNLVQGWNTICLPYNATIADVQAYTIDEINYNAKVVSISARQEILEAGKSYLVYAAAAGNHEVTLSGGAVNAPIEVNNFVGNLSETPVVLEASSATNAYFILVNNEFHLLSGDGSTANVAQYKAYLRLEKNAITAPALRIVENATNINNIEAVDEAVKFIQNGQLFIKKNGVVYNAVGAVVK